MWCLTSREKSKVLAANSVGRLSGREEATSIRIVRLRQARVRQYINSIIGFVGNYRSQQNLRHLCIIWQQQNRVEVNLMHIS